jgi:hypothetical protein
MDLRQISWEGVDWIQLVQESDRWRSVVNAVMNLWGSCATKLVTYLYLLIGTDII